VNREERARTLAHQTEAFAEIDSVMLAIRDAVTRLVEAHAAAKRAQSELAEANRQVSGPEYVQAAS
jgi:hypothetical protein